MKYLKCKSILLLFVLMLLLLNEYDFKGISSLLSLNEEEFLMSFFNSFLSISKLSDVFDCILFLWGYKNFLGDLSSKYFGYNGL